ncbi:MAG: hypothetical protein RR505_07900, partial [Raoultibacter sp.]
MLKEPKKSGSYETKEANERTEHIKTIPVEQLQHDQQDSTKTVSSSPQKENPIVQLVTEIHAQFFHNQ